MTTKQRREFTREFKREAVGLLSNSGRTIRQIAGDLDLGLSTNGKTDGASTDIYSQLSSATIASLQSELKKLEEKASLGKSAVDKFATLSKKISDEANVLAHLEAKLVGYLEAPNRIRQLIADRQQAFARQVETNVEEERVLNELYQPIKQRLIGGIGSLGKLSFYVSRSVNVADWVNRGSELFDHRSKPLKGIASLENAAREILYSAWLTGNKQ